MKRTLILAAVATVVAGQVQARDYISIVGSSTVYPFATVVAEQFGKTTNFKTPKIESTGSGGGLKLFCAGVGIEHPDVTNASRRIKTSEVKKCAGNGVNDILEVKIGYDGIVFANSRKSEPVSIARKQIFLALAKDVPDPNGGETLVPNPHMKWSDVDVSLPDSEIEVLGPPPTSGTRDAFAELALEGGCKKIDWIKAMKKKDKKKYKAICHTVREDERNRGVRGLPGQGEGREAREPGVDRHRGARPLTGAAAAAATVPRPWCSVSPRPPGPSR